MLPDDGLKLKFHSCFTGLPGIDHAAVMDACLEFRNAVRWWINDERETIPMLHDVGMFRGWVDDLKRGGNCGMDGRSPELFPLKREIELSLQFADAMARTRSYIRCVPEFEGVEITPNIKQQVFQAELDHVFSR